MDHRSYCECYGTGISDNTCTQLMDANPYMSALSSDPVLYSLNQTESVAADHAAEILWLKTVIDQRIHSYFDNRHIEFSTLLPPDLPDRSPYLNFLKSKRCNRPEDRLVLALAISKFTQPEMLDVFLSKNQSTDYRYSEFGGVNDHEFPGFMPTIQTALFLIGGDDPVARRDALLHFDHNHPLFSLNVLRFDEEKFVLNRPLSLAKNTFFKIFKPEVGDSELMANIAAKELNTPLGWSDLVLSPVTAESLQELELWLRHRDELLETWGMKSRLNKGYKSLFYGPPGTGKTLTASLLGKRVGQPVYRIDLSQLVSKYIGETSKNLDEIFESAAEKSWILFFDEADSLFGRRTNITNSNDRHANQETAHLLQRIESCENLVILASNLKDNIDEAFLRRFQSIVHFPKPGVKERLKLWKQGFSTSADLSLVDLDTLSKEYEVSGAEINNVIRLVSLLAIDRKDTGIAMDDVVSAIKREKMKSGQLV